MKLRCQSDFWYWADNFPKIRHYETNSLVPFEAFPAQRELIDCLRKGEWAIGLKVRRLGFTAAVIVFLVWLLESHGHFRALAISRKLPMAKKLAVWYREVSDTLPHWLQNERVIDTAELIKLSNGSELMIEAGTDGAGRSLGLDFALFDEARNIESLRAILNAVEPTLDTAHGVACIVSTGKCGTYYERLWKESAAKRTKYAPIFFGWKARGDLTPERYQQMRREREHDLYGFLSEYPENPEEAFMGAAGRVFPTFGYEHIVHVDKPEGAKMYRMFDFGTARGHQQVCVWAWHAPDSNPRLTWEPDCDVVWASPELRESYAYGVDQMFAFSYDEDTHQVIKVNDDIPDAICYGVTTFMFTGHVHIYRTFSIHNGRQLWGPQHIFREVMRLSGWRPVDKDAVRFDEADDKLERYDGCVGDRSSALSIAMLAEMAREYPEAYLDVSPYENIPRVPQDEQKESRIRWVNALIAGDSVPFVVKVGPDRNRDEKKKPTLMEEIVGELL